MADNVTIPASGTGTATPVIATDDVSGVQYQKVKLDLGGDGATNPAPTGAGTESGVLRVTLPTDGTGQSKAIHKESSASTATWTNATADETTVSLATAGYASVVVEVATSGGTFTDGLVEYEASTDGGTNYANIYGLIDSGDANFAPYHVRRLVLSAYHNAASRFLVHFAVGGCSHLRLRLSTVIAGTGSVSFRLLASTASLLPPPGWVAIDTALTGNVPVTVQTAPATAAEGAALPGVFAVVAGDDGTDTQPLQLSAGGDLKVTLDSETVALAAGTNNIGDVDVLSIAAGTNYIGKVRLTDGTLDASLVDETGASAVDALAVGGGTPHDSVDSGNPVKVGFKAANALPTAVANNDRANGLSDLWGRQLVGHIDPAMQVHTNKNYTTQQTGTDVIDPTAGKKIAITSVVIGTYGTTAGRIILWFGDNADTTFTQDTDQVLLAASFAPGTSSKPGLVFTPPTPVFCQTADRELHVTTDAAISFDLTIESYEW